jgi:hypothetical protein
MLTLKGDLAFSENPQSLCRIGFGGENPDNCDLCPASTAKQTQEFGFIGKVGQTQAIADFRLPISDCCQLVVSRSPY